VADLWQAAVTARQTVAPVLRVAAQATGDGPCVMLRRKRRPTTTLGGVKVNASRAVWIIANGDPGDLHVLHTCGQGQQGCIRLGHLYLGTDLDNQRDRLAHGTSNRGERQGRSKLTAADVRRIRTRVAAGETHTGIAKDHGVSRGAIKNIVHGRSWAWLS
jgi:hypothetical protein